MSRCITAEFTPQAWVNDYAMNVDPEGPTKWNVTDDILKMDVDDIRQLADDDYQSDDLRNLPLAPQWIRDWSGPYYVTVEEQIEKFFGCPLAEITEAMVVAARATRPTPA